MLIRIGKFDITECWDGVFYKKLSRYPEITAWEIQTVLDFIRYEKDNGRTCTIEADRKIINAIDRYRQTYDQGIRVSPPEKIEECMACLCCNAVLGLVPCAEQSGEGVFHVDITPCLSMDFDCGLCYNGLGLSNPINIERKIFR